LLRKLDVTNKAKKKNSKENHTNQFAEI